MSPPPEINTTADYRAIILPTVAAAPHRYNFAWRASGTYGLLWSSLLHTLLFYASVRLLAPNLLFPMAEHTQPRIVLSVLLSNLKPDTIESLEEVRIIAPDGLPLFSETPQLVLDAELPDLPALQAGEPGAARQGEQPSRQDAHDLLPREFAALTQGGGYEGRLNPTGRARLLGTRGGTPESEQGVAQALKWITDHQHEDGSWRLDHHGAACGGRCGNVGTGKTVNGATALGLLPLLGAGHTTEHGGYQTHVRRGIEYLRAHAKESPHGNDFHESTMYAQGLVALVFCEAYAMSGDETLQRDAQAAIDFITYAQHEAGGWRYYPKQPGDMTVFGCQFLALESARRSGLNVPRRTRERAVGFLESMSAEGGSCYGYLHPGADATPTAIGLLSCMYLGRPRSNPALSRGIERLQEWRPSQNDMYFNFYATQAMSHYGGSEWTQWNSELRDYLLHTQSRTGHETGSWHFSHEHAFTGGRLYNTALATLVLEVYYRHLPLFDQNPLLTHRPAAARKK